MNGELSWTDYSDKRIIRLAVCNLYKGGFAVRKRYIVGNIFTLVI